MNNQAAFNDTEWQMMGARQQCLQNAIQICGPNGTAEDVVKAAEKFMQFLSPEKPTNPVHTLKPVS